MAKRKMKSITDQRPFVMVYHDFLESDIINPHEKIVFIALKKFANSRNQCFPSLKKLSDISGLSKRKVQDILKELEKKHIITIENRLNANGGIASNLYTLYDFKEMWEVSSSEDIITITEELSEIQLVTELRARGYTVIKEKELDTEPTKAQYQALLKNDNNLLNHDDTSNWRKSQDTEQYTLELIHILYDYDTMLYDYPHDKGNIDSVINILKDSLNTALPTIRIGQEDKPTMVVVSKLLKLNHSEIMYVIQKYKEQKERIKNPHNYILTMLYRAKEQMNLDITNQVQHDMYNWTPETEFDYE